MPPAAWWVGVPWWAGLGFLLVAILVVSVLAPWITAWRKNLPSSLVSREQVLVARQIRLDAAEAAERSRLEVDRDKGWAAVAHPLWHDLNNAVARANMLLLLLQRVLDGKIPKPAALVQLQDYEPLPKPGPLPDVEAVAPKKAGETPYA